MWKKDNFSSFSGFHGRKLFLFCVCFLAQFVSMKFDNSIKDWAYFTSIDTTIELDTNLFNYGVYLSQMRLKFTILNVTANEEDNFGFGFLFAPSLNISSLDYDTSLNTYNYTLDTNVSALYFCSKESVKGWTAITLTENFKSFDPSWSKRIPIHGQQYCYYNASSKSLNGNLLIDPRWPNDMTIIPDQIAYQVIIFDDDPSRHENNNSTSLAKNVQAPTYTYKIPFSLNMVQKACSSIGSQCLFQTINHSDLLYKFDEIECDSKDFGLKKPSTCVSAVVTHTSGNLIHLVGYMHSTALNDSFQIDLDLPTNADLREKTVLQFVCKRGQIPGNRIFLKDSKYTINSQTINNTQYSDRVLLMCAWQIPNVISFNIDRKSISFLLLDQETTLKMTTKRDHENCKHFQLD